MKYEGDHEGYIIRGSWSFILVPENICIDSLARVIEIFEDLAEMGVMDHSQYPTAVFYRDKEDPFFGGQSED